MNLSQVKAPKVSLSFSDRKITLYDEINEDTAFEFINCVNKLKNLDKKIGRKDSLEILINSNGGSVMDGITITSIIEELKKEGYFVITTNIGICASMAFIISICGNEKRCYKNSVYMYHDISVGEGFLKLQSLKEEAEFVSRLKEKTDAIVLKNTKIKKSEIEDWCTKKMDKYFFSEDVLNFGIADNVY